MAEGLLGAVLGDEEDKESAEAGTEAIASAEAFAAAIAAKLPGNDPEVARKTVDFLSEQAQLLKVQREHLKDEHALRLANLHGQRLEGKLRRTSIRIRIAFQLFVAVVAALIGVGVLVMVRDAVASRSVVVDSFDIAPTISTQVPI